MLTVIIPAHNEEMVIGRCLNALLNGAHEGELDIVVVCNGCNDRSAERARAYGGPVRVIEIDEASKTAAINAAERLVTGFPRLYVDADVILSIDSARAIASELDRSSYLLASPVVATDTTGSSAMVRAFYDVWLRLPYNQVMVGTGVYALSQCGRERFGEFPDIIADDGFVRSRFRPQERTAVAGASVTVVAPRTFQDLVNVKTRSRLGTYELSSRYPYPSCSESRSSLTIAASLPWGPVLPWRLAVYLWVNVLTRVKAWRRLRADKLTWDRDEASRLC